MIKDNFNQRKKDILSKTDKSSKKKWDEKIVGLCEKINSLENYYTTSSCSGRVVLIVDNVEKCPGLFVNVWHDLISFEELKKSLEKELGKLNTLRVYPDKSSTTRQECIPQRAREPATQARTSHEAPRKKDFSTKGKIFTRGIIFKQEPVILHVACDSLKKSFDFLKKARSIGFKRGGIISGGKRFVLELIGTEKLEFPIIENKKILVDDKFLKIIVKKSNENLKKGWKKIDKFVLNF